MPTVSVWMTTYNHQDFISRAIEGVLMQQTSFDFELIIGEDFSQDNTREIVKSYGERYPEKIKLFLPEKNLGCNEMYLETFKLCTGKYVAWIDGDDYWTDPKKLQKQFDLLESDPNLSFCFHKVAIEDKLYNSNRHVSADPPRFEDDTLDIRHFLDEVNPVYTVSFFYRNVFQGELPEWYVRLPLYDLGFYFLLLKYGKGKYMKDEMGVYRVHRGGAWSGSSSYWKNLMLVNFYKGIVDIVELPYKTTVIGFLCRHNFILMEIAFLNGDFRKGWGYLKELRSMGFSGVDQYRLKLIKLIAKVLLKKSRKLSSVKSIPLKNFFLKRKPVI